MHHNPAKNVLWVARDAAAIASALGLQPAEVRAQLRERPRATAGRAREASHALRGYHALHQLERHVHLRLSRSGRQRLGRRPRARLPLLRSAHARPLPEPKDGTIAAASRIVWAAARLDGSLDDQAFMAAALLDAFEATLDQRYFEAAERAARIFIEKYGDREGGGFFDRAADAAPMGGLDVRRKPLQDSPTPGGNPVAAMVLDRLFAYTGAESLRRAMPGHSGSFRRRRAAIRAFRGDLRLGDRAARAPPVAGPGDRRARRRNCAARLDRAARSFHRFGKAVLRITPGSAAGALPPALRRDSAAPEGRCGAGIRLRGPDVLSARRGPRKALELLEKTGSEASATAR